MAGRGCQVFAPAAAARRSGDLAFCVACSVVRLEDANLHTGLATSFTKETLYSVASAPALDERLGRCVARAHPCETSLRLNPAIIFRVHNFM
jgi:hypothetical protein